LLPPEIPPSADAAGTPGANRASVAPGLFSRTKGRSVCGVEVIAAVAAPVETHTDKQRAVQAIRQVTGVLVVDMTAYWR
jgi:hypothetical protein